MMPLSAGPPQRKRQLLRPRHAVVVNEVFQRRGNVPSITGAGLHQRLGYFLRHIPRPAFRRVDGDHPDRRIVLPFQQVLNDGRSICALFVDLAP